MKRSSVENHATCPGWGKTGIPTLHNCLHLLSFPSLLGEPGNIFSIKEAAGGVTRFEPLQRDLWLACLERLHQRMEHLGLVTD